MNTTPTKTDSPLMAWWRHNADAINDGCLAATGSVAGGIGLRRDLDAAARGELDIDDPKIRLVVARLCNQGGPSVAQVIREHRQWQEARK